MKKILLSVIAGSMLAGLFASCRGDAAALTGDWQLVFFEKGGTAQSIAISTLCVGQEGPSQFSVSLFSGVNSFFGKVDASGGKIIPAGFGGTQMMGPEPAMEFEREYLSFLNAADSWRPYAAEGVEWLEIASSSQNALARYTRIRLEGSQWKISAMNTGGALVSCGADIRLGFAFGGKASGYTGINTINYGYKADPKTHSISFSEGQMTRMAGSPEEAEAESLFLQNLLKAASYAISGNTLTLRGGDGSALLEFSKSDVMLSL